MVTIKVENKIATNITPDEFWVCGNKDYQVKFEFDSAWEEHDLKTALFVFNEYSVPVPFSGDTCDVPELFNATACRVGVIAGDLITTTPALVNCYKSISDIGGEIPPPPEDVYNRIIELIESGMLKGEKGEKGDKGDKGDAGVIRFISVVSLPTENIDKNAIYLVPIENNEEENRFTEYVYIDGKWEVLGAISVQVDHSEYVKFTDKSNYYNFGVVKFDNNQGIGVNNGIPFIFYAQQSEIDKKTSYRYPITPIVLDYAVKVSVCTNTITLTDEEKASACEWFGAVKVEENTTSVPYVYTDDKTYKHYLAQSDSKYDVRNIPMIFGNAAGKNKPSNGYLLTNDPVNPYHCANKQYVDKVVANAGGLKLYKHILNTSVGEMTLVSYSSEIKTMQQPNSMYDPEYPDEQPEYFEVFVIPQYVFGYYGGLRVIAIEYAIDDIYVALFSQIGFIQDMEINIYSYRVEEYNGGDV